MAKALTEEQKERKSKMNKARRILVKMDENGYVPTADEKALLVETGKMSTEEPTPEEVEKVEEIVETRPATLIDGEVLEITGVITALDIDEGLKEAEVIVLDTDGEDHTISITTKGEVWGMFYLSDSKNYLNGMTHYANMTREEQHEEMNRIIDIGKTLVYRTLMKDGVRSLFAVVSLKYKKSKIEALCPSIKDVVGTENHIQMTPSTGIWGGAALIEFNKDEISQFNLHVNGGMLDGKHSITINVGGMILACANEMVMDVQKLVGDMLPNFTFGVRSVHSGDVEGFKEKLEIAMMEITKFQTVIEQAKDITIEKDEVTKILQFYVEQRVISKKTVKIITETILDDEEIQQVPGTLWGLAMVFTYAGTHCDYNKGVKYALKKTGGELLCVSQVWEEYMTLVNDTVKELEESIEEEDE